MRSHRVDNLLETAKNVLKLVNIAVLDDVDEGLELGNVG